MEINKETLNRYMTAIKSVTNNKLLVLEDLPKLVETLILNIPKISEYLELENSYDIDEQMLIEAVKHITGAFGEFDVINEFSKYSNHLTIDYRVISWMRNSIETFLPVPEIQKALTGKNPYNLISDKSYDFYIAYDTNIETNEYDLIEFRDFNDKDVSFEQMDLRHFSSKSFGMSLELDKFFLDIDSGKKYRFENGFLEILINHEYIPIYEVMSAKEIAELFSHRFERDSAYED